jgi:hypothetical protein
MRIGNLKILAEIENENKIINVNVTSGSHYISFKIIM